jgi:hypothetical protein
VVDYWQADYKNMRPFLNGYDVIVADFRYKDAADHLGHISRRLNPGGLLILASIDDVTDTRPGSKHVLEVLNNKFVQLESLDGKSNRCQCYKISFFIT